MHRKTCKLALLAYAALLLYAGWMPLTLNFTPARVRQQWREALAPSMRECLGAIHTSDGQKNVLLFIPLGALVVAAWHGQRRSWLLVPLAVAMAFGVSVAIETMQLFVVGRVSDLQDVTMNTAGGLLGAILAAIAIKPALRVARRLALYLRNRHALLAAVLLATALLAAIAWRVRPAWAVAAVQWHGVKWSIPAGLALAPWHQWVLRRAGSFAALTLLLTMATGPKEISRRGAFVCATAVTMLALAIELLRLFVPAEAVSLAAVLVAAGASFGAAALAPALHRQPLTLPASALFCATSLIFMLSCLSWSSSGGQTRWPLWGLYSHEHAWAYYATLRRWAMAAAVSATLTFYISLRRPWRLRYRMLAGAALAVGCAALLEAAKALAGPVGGSLAVFLENAMAAIFGTLFFALLWHVLDRRVAAMQVLHEKRGEKRL
jgi:VanZ family protein